jgi:hypothetical protein
MIQIQNNSNFLQVYFGLRLSEIYTIEGEVKLNTVELKSYGYFDFDELPEGLLPLTKKVLLENKDLLLNLKTN